MNIFSRRFSNSKKNSFRGMPLLKKSTSTSTRSIESTDAAEDSESTPEASRRVRFSLCDQSYDSPWVIVSDNQSSEDDTFDEQLTADHEVVKSQCWYAKSEVRQFKQEAQILGRQAREEIPEWTEYLWEAYDNILVATSVSDLVAIMETATDVHASLVGLDKWAMPDLRWATQDQRSVQYEAVAQWDTSCEEKAESIRRVCRDASRTSRFLAVYIARMVESEELSL